MPLPFDLVEDQYTQRNFDTIARLLSGISEIPVHHGVGDPNGVVISSPPALYFNRSGGAGVTIYVKESGVNTSAGWIGK